MSIAPKLRVPKSVAEARYRRDSRRWMVLSVAALAVAISAAISADYGVAIAWLACFFALDRLCALNWTTALASRRITTNNEVLATIWNDYLTDEQKIQIRDDAMAQTGIAMFELRDVAEPEAEPEGRAP